MMKATSSFVLTPFADLWTSRLQKPEVMLGGSQPELQTEMNSEREKLSSFTAIPNSYLQQNSNVAHTCRCTSATQLRQRCEIWLLK